LVKYIGAKVTFCFDRIKPLKSYICLSIPQPKGFEKRIMIPIFSVIIPCYNEEDNLKSLFLRVLDLLRKEPKAEIVLVNNGSTDNSLSLMNSFRLENNGLHISIANVKKNQGYGFGILEGLKLAKSDVLAWTHADLQTDLMDCITAFDVYQKQTNPSNVLVKGVRIERGIAETLLSYGMAFYSSMKLKSWITEINAQPKMFSRSFYDRAKTNAPNDFSLDLHWVYFAKKNGSIKTIPVQFLPRVAGEAKGGSGSSLKTKIKIIKRTLNYVNQLKK
jgi:glycosyltransferase involved in cell wall biosynthesis